MTRSSRRGRGSKVAVAALGFAVAGAVRFAAAQPAPEGSATAPAESGNAEFRRGLELFDARDFGGAAAAWERLVASLGSARGWRVLYNLGLAYQSAGDVTRAIERFDAFLLAVGKEPTPLAAELEDRRQDATERARALRASHGAVRVQAPRTGRAPLVRIDGEPRRVAGFIAYLPPGSHAIEIGEGKEARTVRVDVVAGAALDVETTETSPVGPVASSAVVRRAAPQPAAKSSFPTVWVLIGAGATAGSVVLPMVLRGEAEEERDAAAALGAGHTGYPAAIDGYEAARTRYYVSWALPAFLGAVTGAIVVVGIVGSGGEPRPDGAVRRSSRAELSVGAAPSAGGARAWAVGTF